MPEAELFLLYGMNDRAEEVLKIGAESGNLDAMRLLGAMYFENEKEQEAFYWLEKSAASENPVSLDQLGLCYSHGVGVEANSQKALDLFRKSAQAGYPIAAEHIAMAYMFNVGLEQLTETDDAKYWIEKLSNKGNLEAQNFLGNMYMTGKGVPKDECKAANIYKSLVDKNYIYGFTNLALCYLNGKGVEKDTKKAKEYLEYARSMGSEDAIEIMKNAGIE